MKFRLSSNSQEVPHIDTSSLPAFVIVNGIPNADPPKAMSAAHPVTKKALLVKIDPPPSWFIELCTYIGKDWAKDAALTLSLFTFQFRLVMGCTKQRPETIQ
jgi:hypothetical protein